MSELKLDKALAMRWLDRHGFLTDSYTASDAPHLEPTPKSKSRRKHLDSKDYYDFGLRLWRESKPIPRSFNHPARRWAAQRNLLPPHVPFLLFSGMAFMQIVSVGKDLTSLHLCARWMR